MKKFLIVSIIVIALIVINSNIYCNNFSHRGVVPVNPYCTRCHGRDGFVRHECTNPNGKNKYCPSCGKIVLEYNK